MLKRYNENSLKHELIYRFTYQICVVLTITTSLYLPAVLLIQIHNTCTTQINRNVIFQHLGFSTSFYNYFTKPVIGVLNWNSCIKLNNRRCLRLRLSKEVVLMVTWDCVQINHLRFIVGLLFCIVFFNNQYYSS